jgi:ElaB/YqjD/DUF883 family membrane-anchored ribosome-binding protein
MSTIIQSERNMNQLPEIARNAAGSAKETFDHLADDAKEFAETAGEAGKDVMRHAADTATDLCRAVTRKTGDGVESTREHVRRHPLPTVFGAFFLGAVAGYLLMAARRNPAFGERHAGESMASVHAALLGALSPVGQRIHDGYDSALDGAGRALDRVRSFNPGHAARSFSDRLGRIGENLKFW